MYQWGVADSYGYLLGNWDTVIVAEIEAKTEVQSRYGKFDAVVYETILNSSQKKAICTYRGIGFNDKVEGYHIVYSSMWNRLLDTFKGK